MNKNAWLYYRGTDHRRRASALPHGRTSTYGNWACRCDACREANRVRQAENRKRRHARLRADDPRHGLFSTYTNYGCRCDACRAANTERSRAS